ncbi:MULTISPECIES: HlyD family secretion protein [Bradyrhizobium]|uniref:Multidrug resistance efflux pump n=1 Tax=Bradyrhizobium diazoefficiens (strain JCM 10833 / BCRC 13528 / IAM 13628 / NBRC 14792 / USDA 110) TaxID=224911 RepID=Q89D52_BRADU|nr:HlyD family secretion protein [Bradyrhizobium diazoefficiens]MBP1062013.1 membrane fusion protein (multidrug efflux system) [Bradyrhizobium japonicum]AND92529.1 hemolysin D [Bradyrhizobium diazoefficiens USDA 110]AWO94390.1 HlyD family secretion protein [Bradyrhizobium diazoefficiens]PDT56923.1 HlyD family secretion protein [Bradyrhizobium diazoefficiens]QBP26334.1 HlyD family secretion protein [Bradyrhizobium diazoefficiens]
MSEMPRTENFQQATEITQDYSKSPQLVPIRNKLRRATLILALLAGTTAVVYYGHDYWINGRYLETTDDAYVKADSTIVAPKVSGYIAKVLVGDNEKVKAGQVLARIDDRDFKAALDQARADVAAAEASVRNLDAQLELQQPIIEQSTADVTAADANLKFAQEERARYDDLMKSGSGTIQRAQQTDAALRASNAQLQHAKSGLLAAQRKVDVLTTQRAQATAQLERARAVAQQAALNLSYTEITAPVDGTVGARSLRVGQYVQSGTQLMAVVPLDAVYVVANFKETQLTHVRAGQPVELRVDSFRSQTLRGHVDSLSPASGLEFALLPPDNATGNFTKIVQRVPVKIVLDDHSLTGLLRPGMSAVPTVDTKAAVLAERETAKRLADNTSRPNGG